MQHPRACFRVGGRPCAASGLGCTRRESPVRSRKAGPAGRLRAPRASRFALRAPRSALRAPRFALRALRSALRASGSRVAPRALRTVLARCRTLPLCTPCVPCACAHYTYLTCVLASRGIGSTSPNLPKCSDLRQRPGCRSVSAYSHTYSLREDPRLEEIRLKARADSKERAKTRAKAKATTSSSA